MDSSSETLGKALLDDKKSGQKPSNSDVVVSKPRKVKLLNKSVIIASFVMFTVASCQGVFMVSLWPLCRELGGNKIELGFLVSMHAIGKTCSAHPFHLFAEKFKYGHALQVGSGLLVIGTALWAFCPYLGGLPMLFIAQLLVGSSSASLGIVRAYVSEQTWPHRRTYVLGRLSALEYAGHYAMPIFGALLVTLGAVMSEFMKFALPAMMLCACGAICLYQLRFNFEDIRAEDEFTEADFHPHHAHKHHTVIAAGPTTTYRAPDVEQPQEEQSSSASSPDPARTGAPSSLSPSQHPPVVTSQTSSVSSEVVDDAEREAVLNLILYLNCVVRGIMAVYVTLTSSITLNGYDRSYYELGGLISGAGLIGVFQMLAFKEIWTNHFSDAMMFLVSLFVLGFSQVFATNWTPGFSPDWWSFCLSMYGVIALGGPVASSVALGAFSVMQRAGHQSATHSQLMFLEGAVFIVVPVIAGVLEQCVRRFTTFSVVMMVMGVSIVLVMQKYDVIMKYTDRALIGNPKSSTAIGKSVEIIVLNNWYVRQFFTMMAVFLVFGGFVTFATSVLGSRV